MLFNSKLYNQPSSLIFQFHSFQLLKNLFLILAKYFKPFSRISIATKFQWNFKLNVKSFIFIIKFQKLFPPSRYGR